MQTQDRRDATPTPTTVATTPDGEKVTLERLTANVAVYDVVKGSHYIGPTGCFTIMYETGGTWVPRRGLHTRGEAISFAEIYELGRASGVRDGS